MLDLDAFEIAETRLRKLGRDDTAPIAHAPAVVAKVSDEAEDTTVRRCPFHQGPPA